MTNRISTPAQAIPTRPDSTRETVVPPPEQPFFDTTEGVLNLKHADTIAFPAPDWALPTFVETVEDPHFEPYTPFRGDSQVLADVAANVEAFLSVPIDAAKNIVLSAGTQGGLFAAMAALVEPGAPVALLDPDYMSTARVLRFLGAEPAFVPLRRDRSDSQIDLDALRGAFESGAKLFIFSNPNNPTGILFSEQTLRGVAELVVEYDAVVIADELYSRLTYDGREPVHMITLPGMRERCITALGPSKAESLTGYRLGCMVVPDGLSDAIEDVVGITSMRAPSYAQPLMRRWLRDDAALMRQRRDEYQVLRDLTVAAIESLNFASAAIPGGSSYIFVDVRDLGLSDDYVAEFLLEYGGVAVNQGYLFGPGSKGSFRMCFAQDINVWPKRLEQIRAALTYLHENRPI